MSRSRSDAILTGGLRLMGLLAASLLGLILAFVLWESLPALRELGLRWWTDPRWSPAPTAGDGRFGLAPMIAGTLAVTAGALALAGPLGLACALFCRYVAPPRVAAATRAVLQLLSGVPSVVYGFWGLSVLAPLIGRIHPPGPSLLAGILVLALMVLPTAALLADSALGSVPHELLQAGAALGLSRASVVRHLALPQARAGIATGLLLATGRALGETMAVLMVCGNLPRAPSSLFDPVRTLTANIALEMGFALGLHRSALFLSGLLLLALLLVLLTAARLVAAGRAGPGPLGAAREVRP